MGGGERRNVAAVALALSSLAHWRGSTPDGRRDARERGSNADEIRGTRARSHFPVCTRSPRGRVRRRRSRLFCARTVGARLFRRRDRGPPPTDKNLPHDGPMLQSSRLAEARLRIWAHSEDGARSALTSSSGSSSRSASAPPRSRAGGAESLNAQTVVGRPSSRPRRDPRRHQVLERASRELSTIIDWDEELRKNPLRHRQLASIGEQLAIARGKQTSVARMIERLESRP